MKSSASSARSSRPPFGVETTGLPATVTSARTWPSPGVSISSARHDDRQLAEGLGQPAHAARASARTARPCRCRPCPTSCAARRPRAVNIAPPARSRLPVSTFSTSTSQLASVPNSCVQVPMRAVDAPRVGAPPARAPSAGSRSASIPQRVRHALGREVAHQRARPRRARSGARRGGPGRRGPPRRARARHRRPAAARRCPGRMKWCSSASSAVRVRRGSTTTTLPPRSRMRAQPPAHVGRGQQAAVRHERVGAEHQQVVGAVDVRHRDDEHRRRTSARRETCFGIWSTVDWPSRCSACRARAAAPAVERAPRGCGRSGCRGRRRPRCGRARRGSARAAGRSPRTPRPRSPPRSSPSRRDQRRAQPVGSSWSCLSPYAFGQMKPWLKTSSASPRTDTTSVPSVSISRPQVASQNGQVR